MLDANVLIDANRDYYPIKRIPEFWEWLMFQGEQDLVKIPIEVFEEISSGNDELATWIKTADAKSSLLLAEPVDVSLVIDHHAAGESFSALRIRQMDGKGIPFRTI